MFDELTDEQLFASLIDLQISLDNTNDEKVKRMLVAEIQQVDIELSKRLESI